MQLDTKAQRHKSWPAKQSRRVHGRDSSYWLASTATEALQSSKTSSSTSNQAHSTRRSTQISSSAASSPLLPLLAQLHPDRSIKMTDLWCVALPATMQLRFISERDKAPSINVLDFYLFTTPTSILNKMLTMFIVPSMPYVLAFIFAMVVYPLRRRPPNRCEH